MYDDKCLVKEINPTNGTVIGDSEPAAWGPRAIDCRLEKYEDLIVNRPLQTGFPLVVLRVMKRASRP